MNKNSQTKTESPTKYRSGLETLKNRNIWRGRRFTASYTELGGEL